MGQVGNNHLAAAGLLTMAAEHTFTRPTRELLLRLPLLPTTPDHRIDYEAADPALLLQLANRGEHHQPRVIGAGRDSGARCV